MASTFENTHTTITPDGYRYELAVIDHDHGERQVIVSQSPLAGPEETLVELSSANGAQVHNDVVAPQYDQTADRGDSDDQPQEDIHELFRRVQQHPDFAFGTIFVSGDFPGGTIPEPNDDIGGFSAKHATDMLAERGNLYIADTVGEPDDEDEDDDTPAHKRIREAIRGSVPDDKLEEAVVFAYDMGLRDEHEVQPSDIETLQQRFGVGDA